MEREYFLTEATEMAYIQAEDLLGEQGSLSPEILLSQAIQLIKDCVRFLNQPSLAITFSLNFHSRVELWASWIGWDRALDVVLEVQGLDCTVEDKIRLLNYRSQVARESGDYATAKEMATNALHLAEAHHNEELIAISLNKLGLIAFKQDNLVEAQECWKQAYNAGEVSLPPTQLGHISMNLGITAGHQGQFIDAHHYLSQALAHYTLEQNSFQIAKVHCNLANLLQREGRLVEIPATLQRAIDVFKTIDARHEYALAQNDLGYALLCLEQFDEARAAFQTALDVLEEIKVFSTKALVLSNLVELYVTTAQWDKAILTINTARNLALICQKPLLVAAINVDEGRMLYACGDYAGARAKWSEALFIQISKGATVAAQRTQQLLDTLPD